MCCSSAPKYCEEETQRCVFYLYLNSFAYFYACKIEINSSVVGRLFVFFQLFNSHNQLQLFQIVKCQLNVTSYLHFEILVCITQKNYLSAKNAERTNVSHMYFCHVFPLFLHTRNISILFSQIAFNIFLEFNCVKQMGNKQMWYISEYPTMLGH